MSDQTHTCMYICSDCSDNDSNKSVAAKKLQVLKCGGFTHILNFNLAALRMHAVCSFTTGVQDLCHQFSIQQNLINGHNLPSSLNNTILLP